MQLCFDLSFVELMSAAVQPIPFEYPFPKVGAVMSFGENRVASSVQWQESAPQVCGSSGVRFRFMSEISEGLMNHSYLC